MKQFACALVVATAAAQSFIDFDVSVNGDTKGMKLSTKDWAYAQTQGDRLTIGGNNSLFLRKTASLDESSVFKPRIRGGSIEYDVQVAGLDCGCVAGAYLVDTDNGSCGEVSQDGTPMCKSIDMMQANKYGFETKAHPCENGTCDAISQCIVGMQKQGAAKYGVEAYGPNGTRIDTNSDFHVKHEFVSTKDYKTLWKLRTTLSQGGEEIDFEADCRDYLGALNRPIEGGMGIVLSSWDNRDFSEKFELDKGQSPSATCNNANSVIKNFSVKEWGSTQDMPDDGSDAKEGFLKYRIKVDASETTRYLSTKEWASAETNGSELKMGGNNSLFLRRSETLSDASV
jgi:hypothetical protein